MALAQNKPSLFVSREKKERSHVYWLPQLAEAWYAWKHPRFGIEDRSLSCRQTPISCVALRKSLTLHVIFLSHNWKVQNQFCKKRRESFRTLRDSYRIHSEKTWNLPVAASTTPHSSDTRHWQKLASKHKPTNLYLFHTSSLRIFYIKSWQAFSVKGLTVNIFGFAGHLIYKL